uniref:Uncharacterized protein n=1 Tax=Arundo donax TaxID=35708 RepID=A0A0A9BQM8_ARUDO
MKLIQLITLLQFSSSYVSMLTDFSFIQVALFKLNQLSTI